MPMISKPLWLLMLLFPFHVAFAADAHLFLAKTYETDYGESLNYRLYSPPATRGNAKYPLILFLHGAGERGNENREQLKHGIHDMLAFMRENNQKAYILAPQCPPSKQWVNVPWDEDSHTMPEHPSTSMRLTLELMDTLISSLPVDQNRLYVTGLSMGGFGTWDAIQRRPKMFAAAAPVCGGGDTAQAPKLKDIPIWVWHGDRDNVVKTKRSRDMVAAIKKAGGKPQYTELKGVGHNAWVENWIRLDRVAWPDESARSQVVDVVAKTRHRPVTREREVREVAPHD